MKYFLFFFIFLNEAFGASAAINKIYNGREQASAVIIDKTFALVGYFFTAKFENGNVCQLEILEVVGDFALLDIRLCSMKDYLKIRQKLGSPLKKYLDIDVVSIAEKDYTSPKESFWKKEIIPDKEFKGPSIFLGYNFADSIHFLGMSPSDVTGAMNSYEGEIVANGAALFGIDYLEAQENHFGWNFNGSLEFPRNFDYISANAIGFAYDGPVPTTTLWLGAFSLNINYTFRNAYIPYLGLNVSLPIVDGGNLKISAQLGLQAGLSKIFMNNWIVDLEYRWINFRGGEQLSNQVVQFTRADFMGFLLRLKYLFD
jgi:opacity protein-like surface antigen